MASVASVVQKLFQEQGLSARLALNANTVLSAAPASLVIDTGHHCRMSASLSVY